jgi:hypothetical protein
MPLEVSKLESRSDHDLPDLKSTYNELRSEIDELAIIHRSFPLDIADLLNGIISELTRKLGGDFRDKGIVLITSKSRGKRDVKNQAHVASDSKLRSKDEP